MPRRTGRDSRMRAVLMRAVLVLMRAVLTRAVLRGAVSAAVGKIANITKAATFCIGL